MERLAALGYEPTRVPESKVLGRLLVAMVFGAIVGIDREVTARPAGLRTVALIVLTILRFLTPGNAPPARVKANNKGGD